MPAVSATGSADNVPPPLTPLNTSGQREAGTWYMFYETLSTLSWNGDIGWAWSRDGLRWRHGGICLDLPRHLSFPTVFKWGQDYYMMPETHGDDTISLFVATAFPRKWQLAKHYYTETTQLFGGSFVDHIILHVPRAQSIDNTHTVYMLSHPLGPTTDTFRLFYMDAAAFPLGNWTSHPQSPLTALKATGHARTHFTSPPWTPRTCGPIIEVGGRRYRVAQHSGERVYASEILRLSRAEYAEDHASAGPVGTVLPVLEPSNRRDQGVGWRLGGMHTFDAHALNAEGTEWIIAVDGRKARREDPY